MMPFMTFARSVLETPDGTLTSDPGATVASAA